MPTPRTTWSSSCIHLFKQLKNNETFLDIPAIAFYPSALAAAWQLFLDLQNKPTLWRKHCKPLEPACLPEKWLIWVWKQSQCAVQHGENRGRKVLNSSENRSCFAGYSSGFPRNEKWALWANLKGLGGDLPHYPPPHTHGCGDALFKPALKSFMLLKSLSAEIQGLPSLRHPWKFLPLFHW